MANSLHCLKKKKGVIKIWSEVMKVSKQDIKKKIDWYEKQKAQKELGKFLEEPIEQ